MKIGNIEILSVIDGKIVGRLPSNKPLPDPGSSAWSDQRGMFHHDGRIESTMGGFLVRAGDRVALVDAGGGQAFAHGYAPTLVQVDETDPIAGPLLRMGALEASVRQFAADLGQIEVVQGRLPTSLQAVGIRPEAVTDLIFTHLHFDHIGWASAGGTAFFPNATVRCAAADLDHFLPGTPEDVYLSQVYRALTVAERLGPVLDRVETWESDGTILPGVDVRLAPGHTPGSSVMVISDRTERALILGDMVHCPLELMDDDFNLLVDYDQAMANAVREAYARELEGTNTPVVASHFPGLQFGRLLPSQGVRRWTFDAN